MTITATVGATVAAPAPLVSGASSGASSPDTTPTTPDTPGDGAVKGAQDTGGGAGGGSKGASGQGSGAGATKGVTAVLPDANRVEWVDFGQADKKLKQDIRKAIELTPYHIDLAGTITTKRWEDYLKSDLPDQLSPGGNDQDGRAFALQMVNPTPLARQVFAALFGPNVPFKSVVRVVLTRRKGLDTSHADFLDGLAKGFGDAGIPNGYVERTDAQQSFIKHFGSLDVLTVDNMDQPTGQLRLAQILMNIVKTQDAVDAVRASASATTSSVGAGSNGGGTIAAFVLVLGGAFAFFAVSGPKRLRTRRRRA